MGHNKIDGHGTLDQRIASTLASDVVDKSELTALLKEADAALVEAQRTIETESENALDLNNTDPDTSDELIRKAQRTTARLQKALPLLKDRIKVIEAFEYRTAWHAKADMLAAERDLLAEELAELYKPFIAHITDLYARIDANSEAISDLNVRAPHNENRRLIDAELTARGIDRYDAVHQRLRELLRLPKWDRSVEVAFPPDMLDEMNRRAAQMNEAMTRQLAAKHAFTTGPDWAAGRDLAVEQEEQEFAKRAAELRAAETKSKVEYEARLQEAERRRLVGG